jgi:hypothetical protein
MATSVHDALPTAPDAAGALRSASAGRVDGVRDRPFRSDVTAFGSLLLSAYRGTVDDDGETEDAVAEVERTLAGKYGSFLEGCSIDRLIEPPGES